MPYRPDVAFHVGNGFDDLFLAVLNPRLAFFEPFLTLLDACQALLDPTQALIEPVLSAFSIRVQGFVQTLEPRVQHTGNGKKQGDRA